MVQNDGRRYDGLGKYAISTLQWLRKKAVEVSKVQKARQEKTAFSLLKNLMQFSDVLVHHFSY